MGEIMCYTVNNFLRGCLPMNKTEFIKAVAEKADLTAKNLQKSTKLTRRAKNNRSAGM